jgi:AcrR family transcriptional regulator/DNA-binding MarR family transcriptional regulator
MSTADEPPPTGLRLRPGPSRLPRGRVTEIQRGRILAAAVRTVEELGYAGMTVAQVIGRAQVSRKTFYDVFHDREDCFLAVFEQTVARSRALVMEAAAPESGWRDGMRAGLARLLQFMDDEPGLARLCVVEALGAGERVQESRALVLAELAAAVDRGRSAGGAREPPAVTAEGVVGAVFAVLHTRLVAGKREPLIELLGSLMSIIVLPYLGARAASAELARAAPRMRAPANADPDARPSTSADPLKGLDMRLTHRTVRVLASIGAQPGASNREVAALAEILDQGQISKLLARLQRLELVENKGGGQTRGAANSWQLTERGAEVLRAVHPH